MRPPDGCLLEGAPGPDPACLTVCAAHCIGPSLRHVASLYFSAPGSLSPKDWTSLPGPTGHLLETGPLRLPLCSLCRTSVPPASNSLFPLGFCPSALMDTHQCFQCHNLNLIHKRRKKKSLLCVSNSDLLPSWTFPSGHLPITSKSTCLQTKSN